MSKKLNTIVCGQCNCLHGCAKDELAIDQLTFTKTKMKTTININGNPVEITLTAEQLAEIEANRKTISFRDIKSFQDALDFRGETLEQFNHRTQFDDDVQRAGKELEVIAFAIRLGKPLGTSQGDRWYSPWFNAKRSSVSFSFHAFTYDTTLSYVGSRLCVNTSEEAKYFGEQFLDIWDRYINGAQLTQI